MTENKEKIAISIDPGLLKRIDAVCTARGEARSAWLERIARRAIEEEERFVGEMESPFNRAVLAALTSSPVVIQTLAKVVGDHLTSEETERIRKNAEEQRRRGKERQQVKRNPKPGLDSKEDKA